MYSRAGCSLCEELLLELAALPEAAGLPVEIVDVDRCEADRLRFGHKVPVLLLDGELVCHGRLDSVEVRKALALHGPRV